MRKKTFTALLLITLFVATVFAFPGKPITVAHQTSSENYPTYNTNSEEIISSGTATANITSVYDIDDLYIYNSKAYISDVYSQNNIYIYNASEVVIDRVDSDNIYIYNSSKVFIRNSNVYKVYVYGTADLTLKDTYQITYVYAYDSSKIHVNNSRVYYMYLQNATELQVFHAYIYRLYAGNDDIHCSASIYTEHTEFYSMNLYAFTTANLKYTATTYLSAYGNASVSTMQTKLNYIYGYDNSTVSSFDLFVSRVYLYDNAILDVNRVTTPYSGNAYLYDYAFARIKNNLFYLTTNLHDESHILFENVTGGSVSLDGNSSADFYNSRIDTLTTDLWSHAYAENSDIYSITFNLFFVGKETLYNLSINGHYAFDYYEDSVNPNYMSSVVLKDCTYAFYHVSLATIFINSTDVTIDSTNFGTLIANGTSNIDVFDSVFADAYLYDTSALNADKSNSFSNLFLYDQSNAVINGIPSLQDIFLFNSSFANLTSIDCDNVYIYDMASLFFFLSTTVNIYASTSIYDTYVPQAPNVKLINSTVTGDVINNGTMYVLINFTSVGGSVWSYLNGTTKLTNATVTGNIYWTVNVLTGNAIIDSYMYYTSGGNYWFNSSWDYASNARNNTIVVDSTYSAVSLVKQIFFYGGSAIVAESYIVTALRSSEVTINGSYVSPAGNNLVTVSSNIYGYETASVVLYNVTVATSTKVLMYDQAVLKALNVTINLGVSLIFHCKSVLIANSFIVTSVTVYGTTFLNITNGQFLFSPDIDAYGNSTMWGYNVTGVNFFNLYHNSSLSLYNSATSSIIIADTNGSVYVSNSTIDHIEADSDFASITLLDSVVSSYVDLVLNYGSALLDNVSVGTNFHMENGTLTLNNVTISNTAYFYEYLTATVTNTVFATNLYIYDNVSATITDSRLYHLDLYESSEAYLQNVTFTAAASHLYLNDFANATLINCTLTKTIAFDFTVLYIELHSVTMDLIRAFDLSRISGAIENSSIDELKVANNGTAIIDGSGNTNFTNVLVYNFGYLELTNVDQIGTAYIDPDTFYKPLLSGNITLLKSNVWINGSAVIENLVPSGSFSVFAKGTFQVNQLLPWYVYLNDSDSLLLNATDVLKSIILNDNANVTLYNVSSITNGIEAYDNSVVTILGDVYVYQNSYFYDSSILNITGVPHKSSINGLYLFNSTTAWIRNATISTMYVSGTVAVHFMSYDNSGVGPLNETITVSELYVAPYVLTSAGLVIDASIQHDPLITSVDQGEQYLTISDIFEGYNLRASIYDAQIYVMYIDNVSSGYFNNVSFTSLGDTSGVGMVYDFFDNYNLEPAFYGNVTFENCTANTFYAISTKPTTFINTTIAYLYYAYLVNGSNTLLIDYDTNSTEILNSGTGYVTYENITSSISNLGFVTLGAVDNGHLIIKNRKLSYSFSSSTTYQRTSSSWSGVNKTRFYVEYDYTQYGINHLSVTVSCNDDNITWTRIDVMAANGTWYTIVNDTFDTSTVTDVQYTFENFTDIFGSLAYKVRVWVNVSDNTGATQTGYVRISRGYDTNMGDIELMFATGSAEIEVNKAYAYAQVFLKDNAQLKVLETGFVDFVAAFENARIFVNNTITDFNCPYLENQTKMGVLGILLMEHSTAEMYNSRQTSWVSTYLLYDYTSLSVYDSVMRSSITSGVTIDIWGESSVTLRNVTFTYFYIHTTEGNVSATITDSDLYYYRSYATNAFTNSVVSTSNISYVYIYGNGSYIFDTISFRVSTVYLYSEFASWTFRNISYMYTPWSQVTIGVNYDYEISNVLDITLMNNDQLYAGRSRVFASSTRLNFDSVTLRDVGAYYSISVTDPVIDYDSTNEVINLSGIVATCNNTAHGTLDNTEAVQHYYAIYDSASNIVLQGTLSYAGNDTWVAENISVAALLPATYSVVAYFTDSDARGQSAPVSFTVTHYLSITQPTLEFNDEHAYLSIYNIHAYSSYTPIGEVDDSEATSATYQIIDNDTGDVVATGNLAWNGNAWVAMNVSTLDIPTGVYFVRVSISDSLNNTATVDTDTFAVGVYYMLFGSRVSMMALILGIVSIVLAAGIPIVVFLILLKKGKLQNLFS